MPVVDVWPSSVIYPDVFTAAEFAKALNSAPTWAVHTGAVPVYGVVGGNTLVPMSAYLPVGATVNSIVIYVYAKASVVGRRKFGFFAAYNPSGPSSAWQADQAIGTTDGWYTYTIPGAELASLGWTTDKLRAANNEWRFGLISTNATSTTTSLAHIYLKVNYTPAPPGNVLFFGENF